MDKGGARAAARTAALRSQPLAYCGGYDSYQQQGHGTMQSVADDGDRHRVEQGVGPGLCQRQQGQGRRLRRLGKCGSSGVSESYGSKGKFGGGTGCSELVRRLDQY